MEREGVLREGMEVLREGIEVLREMWRYARGLRLSSDNVPEGARGAICIKRLRLPESRLDVIWVTYAFMQSNPGY